MQSLVECLKIESYRFINEMDISKIDEAVDSFINTFKEVIEKKQRAKAVEELNDVQKRSYRTFYMSKDALYSSLAKLGLSIDHTRFCAIKMLYELKDVIDQVGFTSEYFCFHY